MSTDLYVARPPILDQRERIIRYELLFRGGPESFFAGDDPDPRAPIPR